MTINISIITWVIIVNPRALIGHYNYAIITSGEVIIARGQIFKMVTLHFVDVSEEEINLMKVRNDTLQR